MIWKRKWCSLAVVLLLITTMFPSAAFGADPLSDDIVILFSSDVHGQVEDNLGYAGLVAYKNEKLTTHRYVSVVDAGDAISGSMLASASEGEFTAEAMDLVGYTAAAVGVHEFDFGVKHFINTIAKNANFSYVSCNFADAKGNPVFAPYKLVNYGSTKVAYLGISDPQTIKKSTASFGEGKYSFYQGNDGYTLFEQVQKAIDQAKAEGADYVIAISHLETDQDCLYTPHAVARNTSGLTAIINGNAHEEIVGDKVVDRKGNTVLVTACGSGLQTIGEIVISDHKTVTTSLISKYQLKDAATTDGIDALKKSYCEDLSQAFATAVTPLTAVSAKGSRIIENNETNLGDLCADAYRIMTGADIALVEAKALQKNIAAGDISYQDVMKALPIQEPISVIEMTGATLMDALEMSVRLYPKRNAAFLQVSGLTYDIQETVNTSVTLDGTGDFTGIDSVYRVDNIMIHGKPIDLFGKYKVAVPSSLQKGGSGYTMFASCEVLQSDLMMNQYALVQYISNNLKGHISGIYTHQQGRIDSVKLVRQSEIDKEIEKGVKEQIHKYEEDMECLERQLKIKDQVLAIKETVIQTSSKYGKDAKGKRYIKVSWTANKDITGLKYQVWKSSKKNSGFRKAFTTVKLTYTNTAGLAKGKTYYYKVRGYKIIDGKYYYTNWSNKAYRTIK